LSALVAIGLALQLGHELVLMAHTRVQARLAQRMVFDCGRAPGIDPAVRYD